MPSKKRISDLLLDWYYKNGRVYPWRKDRSPYKTLIAEIMLQRTRAEQVIPVYLLFLKEFPDATALNQAPEDKIRKYFSKLGLIKRARLVKQLAAELTVRFSGKVPHTKKELLSLPSVGEYIADAVLAFSFGRDVGVIDSNVCRILGRVFGLRAKGEARRDKQFREFLDKIVPTGKAADFNYAMIDLGALVCTPKHPSCVICPLVEVCLFAQSSLKAKNPHTSFS